MSDDFLIGYGLASAVLWSFVLAGAVRDVRRYQDDRAAYSVLMALVLVLVSVGFVFARTTEDGLTTFLAHVARGSVIVGAVVIVIVRLGKRRNR